MHPSISLAKIAHPATSLFLNSADHSLFALNKNFNLLGQT